MKKIIIIFLAACAQFGVKAQTVTTTTSTTTALLNPGGFYIKGGLNLANISVNNNGAVNDANTLATFNVGFTGDIPLADMFSLQLGLILNGQGAKTDYYADNNNTNDNYTKSSVNPLYLQIPANIVVKIPIADDARLFVGAGPYLQMGIGGTTKVETRSGGVSTYQTSDIQFNNDDITTTQQEDASFNKLKLSDWGLNGLAGIETGDFMIGVNYGWGLTKINSTQNNNSANDKNKYRTFSINVGFRL